MSGQRQVIFVRNIKIEGIDGMISKKFRVSVFQTDRLVYVRVAYMRFVSVHYEKDGKISGHGKKGRGT